MSWLDDVEFPEENKGPKGNAEEKFRQGVAQVESVVRQSLTDVGNHIWGAGGWRIEQKNTSFSETSGLGGWVSGVTKTRKQIIWSVVGRGPHKGATFTGDEYCHQVWVVFEDDGSVDMYGGTHTPLAGESYGEGMFSKMSKKAQYGAYRSVSFKEETVQMLLKKAVERGAIVYQPD